jgi:uncharacterized repeat protein (TIGR03803 family)
LEPRRAPSITTLATFTGSNGANPEAGLVLDGAGNLYGTTVNGGAASSGTVFEVQNGSGTVTTLATFNGTNGAQPFGGLVDAGGNFFGTTAAGGASGAGTIFEIPSGSGTLATLASFSSVTTGRAPLGTLLDVSGSLLGTASAGGPSGDGTVFELANGSHTITGLASFSGTNGANPNAGLLLDSIFSGNLFGTAVNGGSSGQGTVFEIKKGTSTITAFSLSGFNGAQPYGDLIKDASGNLFTTTAAGGSSADGTVLELRLAFGGGYNPITLANFTGTNGAGPRAGLVFDTSGDLFGTTAAGGDSGLGTVFEIPQGTNQLTTIASFNGANGANPYGGLVLDSSGNVYGTTEAGGASSDGTVFSVAVPVTILTPNLANWTVNQPGYSQTLTASAGNATFTYATSAGTLPAGLTLSSAGVLSGTPTSVGSSTFTVTATDAAGASGSMSYTVTINPTVMMVTTSLANWTVNQPGYSQTLNASGGTGTYTFSSSGTLPPGLTLSTGGILSGTPTMTGAYTFMVTATDLAGASASRSYTITINPPVTIPSIPLSWGPVVVVGSGVDSNGNVLGAPRAGLIEDQSGDLFGTTNGGATNKGTVFELPGPPPYSASGVMSILATFNGSNGSFPHGNLVEDDSGSIFGTTEAGGGG